MTDFSVGFGEFFASALLPPPSDCHRRHPSIAKEGPKTNRAFSMLLKTLRDFLDMPAFLPIAYKWILLPISQAENVNDSGCTQYAKFWTPEWPVVHAKENIYYIILLKLSENKLK